MPVYEDNLTRGNFRYIEDLLRMQKTHDSAIAELEAELAELLEDLLPGGTGSFVDMTASKGETDSQPEAWTIKRDENLRVRDLRQDITRRKRHKAAVSEAMRYLDEADSQLVMLRYNLEKPHSYVAKKLNLWDRKEHVPLSTYWRTRRRVIEKVAGFLGL